MSVNKISCNSGRLTLHGDYVVYHQDGVEFSLDGDAIPGFLKGSRKGNVFISTHKVIFAPTAAGHYGSFSMNFQSIRNVEVKQPMFGANFVKGDVISEPDGGWQGRGTFKVVFNSGGAIEFAERFRHCVVSGHRQGAQPPPQPVGQPFMMNSGGYYTPHHPFVPPPPGHYVPSPQGYYSAPPPGGSYATPPQGYYYPAPPPGGYPGYPPPVGAMTQPPPYQPPENPPPYPGQAAPSAPPSEAYFSGHTGDVKAREAYTSGQNVYVPAPQPPPPYAPPPYNPADKKNV